ncbi:MAG: DUF1223 domain-containing protein [Alphaproteobacteria bacterium]|nr:DUF1223 domain-containing protein [Alphaproteobacteria bacterium]
MFLRPVIAIALLGLATLSPALAGETRAKSKAVLELFTSQGCSSCPPADALLEKMSENPDYIALAYHVDYWDYIGWPDTYGAKANSDRQRDYAASWGSSRIFTPQLVVNGVKSVVASRRAEVESAVGATGLHLPIDLTTAGDMLEVSVAGDDDMEEAVVWLITFIDRAEVDIQRGENKGKKIAYTQIVTGRQAVGMWEPQSGARFKLPLTEVLPEGSNGAVIMIQQERDHLPGRILGAASYTR